MTRGEFIGLDDYVGVFVDFVARMQTQHDEDQVTIRWASIEIDPATVISASATIRTPQEDLLVVLYVLAAVGVTTFGAAGVPRT